MSNLASIADFHRQQAIYCRCQATKETDQKLIDHWLDGAARHTQKADELSGELKPCDTEVS